MAQELHPEAMLMKDGRYRLAVVTSHPTQSLAPIYRRLATNPGLDLVVAYCSLQGVEAAWDPDFGMEVKWDVPLLDGYPWVRIPNRSLQPRVGHFFGLINPGLWRWLRHGGFDAVLVHTGYFHFSYWILVAAAKTARIPLIFATDAVTLGPRDASWWKKLVKPLVVPKIYNINEIVAVGSSMGREFIRSLGIADDRIVLVPNVVDNDWWTRQAALADGTAIRAEFRIAELSPVVLFCAKLQPWKRPLDLLRAFAQANPVDAYLVYAGEGPLRSELSRAAEELNVASRVRFLGFVNQSRLPSVYHVADLVVVPSEYEPFGLVVNEAMLCGCPAAASDRVGAARDLITSGENGFVYSSGDVDELAGILRTALSDLPRLRVLGACARQRMDTWSPRESEGAILQAIEEALRMRARSARGVQ
jgi:glycosyltransferase involved in cell wall biosynthesis